mgnify:CR=1 FL=1
MPSSLKGLARPETRLVAPELFRPPAPKVPLDGRAALRRVPPLLTRPVQPPRPVPLAPVPLPLPRPAGRRRPEPTPTASTPGWGGAANSVRLPVPARGRYLWRLRFSYTGLTREIVGPFGGYRVLAEQRDRIWVEHLLVERERNTCEGDWSLQSVVWADTGVRVLGFEIVGFIPCAPPPPPPTLPPLPETEKPEPRVIPFAPPWTIPVFPEEPDEDEPDEDEPEEQPAPLLPAPLEPEERPRPAPVPNPQPATPRRPRPAIPPLREPQRLPARRPEPRPTETRPRPPLPRPDVPPPVPRPDPRPARQQPPPPPEQPQRRRQSPPVVLIARVERIETGETSTSETLPDPRPNPPETQTCQCPELDLDCLKRWCGSTEQYLDYYVGKWERQGYVGEKRDTKIIVPTPLFSLVEYVNDRLKDLKTELIEAIDLIAFIPAEALESWPKTSAQPYWEVYWGARRRNQQSLKRIRIPGGADLTIPKPPEIHDGKTQLIVRWPGLTFPYTRIWVGQGSAEAIEGWLKSFKGEFEVRFQESPTRNFQTGRLVPTRRRHWNGSRWLPPQRWD